MNVERLHAIVKAIQGELNGITSHLGRLVDALGNQVSQPQQAAYQQQVSETLRALHQSLQSATSNQFSPLWRQNLHEIGADDVLGLSLDEKLTAIFQRNQITPSTAQTELQQIRQKADQIKAAVDHLVAGFSQMNIGTEILSPGECDIGVLVPRAAVHNELGEFAGELSELNFIFKTFQEMVTGETQGLSLKTVSSSDFLVYVAIATAVGSAIAQAVDKLLTWYKTLLEIRKARSELSAKGVPESSLAGLKEYAQTMMGDRIKELTEEILQQHQAIHDKDRRSELKNAVQITLTKIANRIDQGFNIEIRVQEPSEPEKAAEQQRHIETIKSTTSSLRYVKLEGDPILLLPETEIMEDEPEAKISE